MYTRLGTHARVGPVHKYRCTNADIILMCALLCAMHCACNVMQCMCKVYAYLAYACVCVRGCVCVPLHPSLPPCLLSVDNEWPANPRCCLSPAIKSPRPQSRCCTRQGVQTIVKIKSVLAAVRSRTMMPRTSRAQSKQPHRDKVQACSLLHFGSGYKEPCRMCLRFFSMH